MLETVAEVGTEVICIIHPPFDAFRRPALIDGRECIILVSLGDDEVVGLAMVDIQVSHICFLGHVTRPFVFMLQFEANSLSGRKNRSSPSASSTS